MTLNSDLRRILTNATEYTTQIFNAPGGYTRPYGRTNFEVIANAIPGGAGVMTPGVFNNPSIGYNPGPYVEGTPNYNPDIPGNAPTYATVPTTVPGCTYEINNCTGVGGQICLPGPCGSTYPYYSSGVYPCPGGPATYAPGPYIPGYAGDYSPCCGTACQSGMGNCNACTSGCLPCGSVSTPDGCGGTWDVSEQCHACGAGMTNPYQAPPVLEPGTFPSYYEQFGASWSPCPVVLVTPGNAPSPGNVSGSNPPYTLPPIPYPIPGTQNSPTFAPGLPSASYVMYVGNTAVYVPGTPGSMSVLPAPGGSYTTYLDQYQVPYSANPIPVAIPPGTSAQIRNLPE